MKKLVYNEVVRCQPTSLQRKLFHTSSFMYITFIFSGCITIASSEEGLKMCEYNFFQRKVVLLVIYLFNYDSSKATTSCWIWLSTFSWVQFLSNTVKGVWDLLHFVLFYLPKQINVVSIHWQKPGLPITQDLSKIKRSWKPFWIRC